MDVGSTIKKTVLITFLAVSVISGGLVGWGQHLDNQHEAQQRQAQAASTAAAQSAKAKASAVATAKLKEIISYDGVAGQNALVILKTKHAVTTKTYSFGEQVLAIDSLEGNGPKYWTFYVNGKMSDVGAGSYVTQATDVITWKLEQL